MAAAAYIGWPSDRGYILQYYAFLELFWDFVDWPLNRGSTVTLILLAAMEFFPRK